MFNIQMNTCMHTVYTWSHIYIYIQHIYMYIYDICEYTVQYIYIYTYFCICIYIYMYVTMFQHICLYKCFLYIHIYIERDIYICSYDSLPTAYCQLSTPGYHTKPQKIIQRPDRLYKDIAYWPTFDKHCQQMSNVDIFLRRVCQKTEICSAKKL